MKKWDDGNLSSFAQMLINEPGDVGEEQLPAGVNKTDKAEWNYADNGLVKDTPLKRLEDWGTKCWGYRK